MRRCIPILPLLITLGTESALFSAAALQAPLVRVQEATTGFQVTWTAQPHHRYRIETALQLDGVWATAVEQVAQATEETWTDTSAVTAPPQSFFRVLNLGAASTGTLTADAAFRAADLVPLELSDRFDRSAQDTVDAVQVATAFAPTGSPPVTNGTIRLTGVASNPVQYEPLPRDRFVLIPLQGPAVEIQVLLADVTRGISEWRQVSAGSDLVFRSELGSQANRATVKGRYVSGTFAGVIFDVDLAATITGFSEVDSNGNHTLTDSTITGRVTTEGFTQTVQTRNRFEFVSARGISGRLESASTSENWNNNAVVLGGDTFVWNNVKKQRSFRDGNESQLDTYWKATGAITRNGQAFGQYRKTLTPVGLSVIDVRFQVVLADRVIDVEQWTVQVPTPAAP